MSYAPMTLAAIQAALSAGEFLRKAFNTAHQITLKGTHHNFVTESDLGSEERILSHLRKEFPSHGFLSEESDPERLSAEILWVIDPLDGTLNFAHHIPHFSISIAACTPHETLVGVVYQPITQELFVAEKGKGAFLQGSRLNVSSVDLLSQALLASGFPYDVENNPRGCIDLFSSFLHQGLPIRRLGSAAIDLAYLAAGRWEAYWETGIHPWDIAAGALLVEEAGGKITTWEGMPHPIIKKADILATNGPLHPAMLQALRSPS